MVGSARLILELAYRRSTFYRQFTETHGGTRRTLCVDRSNATWVADHSREDGFPHGEEQERRIDEVRESLSLIEQFVAGLPAGPLRAEVGELPADRTALGYVEGWRGEILHWIRTAPGNRLARCKVKDPSLQNWPALSEAILGNIIPDFPVVNKSFNLSYSGNDR